MVIFDKNSITNEKLAWFKNKLDDNFIINDPQRSKVIFGFNGIGKTTLFNCIKELNNNEVEFLEYIELNNTLIKAKDVIVISSNVNQIESLKSQINVLKSNVDLRKNLRNNFEITNKQIAGQFGERIEAVQKDGSFSGFIKQKSDITFVENKLTGIPPKVFIDSFQELENVQSATQELKNEKAHLLFHALSTLDSITKTTDAICPVCGNNANNLKHTIQTKMTQLNNVESLLINKLKNSGVNVNTNVINDMLTAYRLLRNDSDLTADYLICNGNSSEFEVIQHNYIQIQALESQLRPLIAQAQGNYNNIQNVKNFLEEDLNKYFNVTSENVTYDEINFTITIKFPRKLETYSTGELNLISFLYKVYSFVGSDKKILLLDDPVSSLDLVNHYKIAYEIVRNDKNHKKLIVLTHSVEFINVVNSQHPGKFDFYYLEQSNDIISIQKIPLDRTDPNPNIISLDKLTDTSDFNGFIEALKTRETNPTDSSIQKLFHYSINKEHLNNDVTKFSNHDLIDLIDNFTGFTQTNFLNDSFLKVKYLTALRIWLEKKLFELIPLTNTLLIEKFLNERTLSKKIDCIFPLNNPPTVTVPNGLTRDILVSKKVMLNQGVHYYSQIMPFAYAINLSLDMLKEEIIELINLFH